MKLRIEKAETDSFLRWCRDTIRQRSKRNSIRPYDYKRDAILFSLDVNLNLFLGKCYGQNPPIHKTYSQSIPRILSRLRLIALEFGRESGGRFFIDNHRYYFVDRASREITLCDLAWSNDVDVVAAVRDFWLELPVYSGMTIRLSARKNNFGEISSYVPSNQ